FRKLMGLSRSSTRLEPRSRLLNRQFVWGFDPADLTTFLLDRSRGSNDELSQRFGSERRYRLCVEACASHRATALVLSRNYEVRPSLGSQPIPNRLGSRLRDDLLECIPRHHLRFSNSTACLHHARHHRTASGCDDLATYALDRFRS